MSAPQAAFPYPDPRSDMILRALGLVAGVMVVLVALPLAIPVFAARFTRDRIATKTRFWVL